MMVHGRLDHVVDGEIPDLFLQEHGNRQLIGRVEYRRQTSARRSCPVCQGKGREVHRIRILKGDVLKLSEVQPLSRKVSPLRIIEGVLDGQLHVRRSQLGNHSPVHILDHGVNHALGLNHHLYLVHRHVKEPVGLHHLQPLVDHGGAVNGNLLSHMPVRVLQGIRGTDVPEGLPRSSPEGAAAGRQQNLVDRIIPGALQTLEYGRMLAVHRKDLHALGAGKVHDDMARRHQSFLVGKGDILPRLHGRDGRTDADHAHYGSDHNLRLRLSCRRNQPLHTGMDLYIQVLHPDGQVRCRLLII